MNATAKDLTKEAPASPADRVGGYVILARLADKARAAFLGGKLGEFHTDCPLDRMLLDWKDVPYADLQKEIESGAENEELAAYLDGHGVMKTPEEVEAWSDEMEDYNPSENPEKKAWFAGECAKLDLDPESTTLFEWLETDDDLIGK